MVGTRYYDPSLGRWTQQDSVAGSIGDPGSMNRYVYVGDDPVNFVDPTGRLSVAEGVFGAIGIIGFAATITAAVATAPITVGVATVVGISFGAASAAAVVGCAFEEEEC